MPGRTQVLASSLALALPLLGACARSGPAPGDLRRAAPGEARGSDAPPARASDARAPLPPAARVGSGRVFALLVNGGGSPDQNYASHVDHLRGVLERLARAGVPPARITVLASDGADPAADVAAKDAPPAGAALLTGTAFEATLVAPLRFESTALPGATLGPATPRALDRWFTDARGRLRAGDTLFLYVTDHGTNGTADPLASRIVLWGRNASISVRQLKALLGRLPAGVRVVTLMSQCFSGGFAHLALGPTPPNGAVCGYFSTTADRPAYGCYPESRGRDGIGHSFELLGALDARGSLPQAHAAILSADDTPDVPLRTSDVYLRQLVARGARAAGQDEAAFADRLLEEAAQAPGTGAIANARAGASPPAPAAAGESRRLVAEVAASFGLAPPATLASLDEARLRLEQLARALDAYGRDWDQTLAETNQRHLERFLETHPEWNRRLTPAALRALGPDERRARAERLLAALRGFLGRRKEASDRVAALDERGERASGAAYRTDVRLGTLERLRHLLLRLAGEVYLATRGTPEERAGLAALTACEDFSLPGGPARPKPPRPPLPPLAEDERVAHELRPGWLGIAFQPAAPRGRPVAAPLTEGASTVTGVVPGSPAAQAGLRPGDVVLGPPGAPFADPEEIKSWTKLAPVGKAQRLVLLRRGERLVLDFTPAPLPLRQARGGGEPGR